MADNKLESPSKPKVDEEEIKEKSDLEENVETPASIEKISDNTSDKMDVDRVTDVLEGEPSSKTLENEGDKEMTTDEAAEQAEQKEEAVKPAKRGRQKKVPAVSPPPLVSERPQRERRKSAPAYIVEDTRDKTADVKIKEGKGTPLKEIPSIAQKLAKRTRNDEAITRLHSLLFSKRCKAAELKNNILNFSGYVWDSAGRERQKVKEKLERHTKDILQDLLDILDLPKKGTKLEQIERTLNFLEMPQKTSDNDVADKETSRKRKVSGQGGKVEQKGKKGSGKGKSKMEEEEEDDDEDEDEDEDDEDDEDDEVEKVVTRTPKKKQRSAPSKSPKKITSPRARMPTNAQLTKKVNELISGGDMPKVAAEQIVENLESHFGLNLSSKRGVIEELVNAAMPKGEVQEGHKEGIDAENSAVATEDGKQAGEEDVAAAEKEETLSEGGIDKVTKETKVVADEQMRETDSVTEEVKEEGVAELPGSDVAMESVKEEKEAAGTDATNNIVDEGKEEPSADVKVEQKHTIENGEGKADLVKEASETEKVTDVVGKGGMDVKDAAADDAARGEEVESKAAIVSE